MAIRYRRRILNPVNKHIKSIKLSDAINGAILDLQRIELRNNHPAAHQDDCDLWEGLEWEEFDAILDEIESATEKLATARKMVMSELNRVHGVDQ